MCVCVCVCVCVRARARGARVCVCVWVGAARLGELEEDVVGQHVRAALVLRARKPIPPPKERAVNRQLRRRQRRRVLAAQQRQVVRRRVRDGVVGLAAQLGGALPHGGRSLARLELGPVHTSTL